MRGPTLSFTSTKTYGPIFVNLREKLELLSLKFFFSLFSRTLSVSSFLFPFEFHFFLFIISFLFFIHGSHCAMCPSLIQVCFFSETIYFFSVQFILNQLSPNHFLTFEVFVRTSSLDSLVTYQLENRKNIPTVSEFDETFLGH